jgi:phage-related baseplate assembly protein
MQGVSVASVTSTEGGGDLELDEQYRGRMLLAPAKYGGGSASAYRHHALSASSLVSDALAVAGRDGTINIYVLADSGAPSNDLLRIVQDYCSRPDIRLIGDTIAALPAIEKPYTIKGGITVFADHDPQTVLDKVRAHAHAYAKKTSAALGTDITPAQILMALAPERDGLYNVTLDAPAGVISIAEAEWGHATEIDIALLGVAR